MQTRAWLGQDLECKQIWKFWTRQIFFFENYIFKKLLIIKLKKIKTIRNSINKKTAKNFWIFLN